MLVGDENRRNGPGIDAPVMQRRFNPPRADAGIDEDPAFRRAYVSAVPTAAAE